MAGQFVSCAFVVCFAKYSTTRNLQTAAELSVSPNRIAMKIIAQIILLIIFIWFYFDTFGFLEGVVIGFLLLLGAIANSKL